MSGDPHSADVFDFVDAYLAALERGEDPPLAHWLARFPRSQEAIAAEWLALKHPHAAAPTTRPATNGAESSPGEGRFGPYRTLRELGRGGQGTVFLAEDTRIARRVALKVLATRFDSVSDEKRQRFKREADVIARLEHPGLCTIHDADLDAETPWIAMRFVEGRTLGECLVEARDKHGAEVFGLRLPPRDTVELFAVLALFERAARALHAAHEAGVVHRDVKPGNVIVALDGRPVLLDFGLARDETSETGTLTQSGDVFGTPAYMSPEQLTLPSSQLDRRTDVYSLGVALYEALTLERPFEHQNKTALYRAIASDPPPDPRKKNKIVSAELAVVLETALEKERARRYPTTLELAEDLRRIREYEPIHARPASVGLKLARWTRRHPSLAVAIGGTILSLAIGLTVSLNLLAREQRALGTANRALADSEKSLSFALGKHLAQRAVALSVEDPPSSVLLGIEGVERVELAHGAEREPNELARSSLLTALDSCWLATDIGDEERRVLTEDVATSPSSDLVAAAFRDPASGALSLVVQSLALHASPAPIPMPAGRLVELEFDARGERLLWAVEGGGIEIRDPRTGAVLGEASLSSPITCARFAPDGTRVLVIGRAIGARLLDARTLAARVQLDVGEDAFESARFGADGALLAAFRPGAQAAVFATADGRRLYDVTTGGGARDVQFVTGPLGLRLLVAGVDGAVHVLDAASGAETGPTFRTPVPPTALVASGDGRHAAVIANRGEEGGVFLCNLALGGVRPLGEFPGRFVSQAAFSPDRTRIAVALREPRVRIYDVSEARLVREFRSRHAQADLLWSADGERLVTRTNGSTAQVWFARIRPDLFDLEGHTDAVCSVAFLPGGRRALSASADGTARIWNVDPDAGAGLGRELVRLDHGAPLRVAQASRDGEVVLTTGADSNARAWDALTGAALRPAARHPSAIRAAALSTAGDAFATLCADGRARLWPARGDGDALVLEGTVASGSAVVFSPDGALLAIGDEEDAIRLYDARDGRLARTLAFEHRDDKPGGVVALAFHPHSDELAVACNDWRLRWFRPSDGASLQPDWFRPAEGASPQVQKYVFAFRDLAFSRDGTRLLLVGAWGGGAVRSISLADGATRFSSRSHVDDVTSACYAEDGALVLTTSKDGSARAWRTSDGTPLVRREGFASALLCGDVSNALGEARAITGSADGRVCVWPVDPLPAARSRELPPLSAETRRREREQARPLEYR